MHPANLKFRRLPALIASCALAFLGLGAEAPSAVHLLVPGFRVEELPVRLSNQNSLRFDPEGFLTSLGYDGRIWRLRDTDHDGLEDTAEPVWDKPGISVPVGMAWTTHGLYVTSHGKLSLLRDTHGDGRPDVEEIVASGWPPTDAASGGVDATAVAVDPQGNVYFGLLVADYANAYRLRQRKDLTPAEKAWLAAHGKPAEGDPMETVSLYDLASPRGTIQKWDPRTRKLETIATGMRVPYTLAFNQAGDLFNTDQEGETWMPNGNPLDELNHIVAGRNYGFPPPHPQWLPGVVSQAPVVGFGPQHESTCGFVFNEPSPRSRASKSRSGIPLPASPGQGLFGPREWKGNAIVAGESRGKLWRVPLVRTASGYHGREQLFARFDLLVTDVAISPRGDLYVSCHSGPPDWGTGPQGTGHLFRISYVDPKAPQPLHAWPESATEVRVQFHRPVDPSVLDGLKPFASRAASHGGILIEFGTYVRAADRLETLKPPYAVVRQQDATPRGHLAVRAARLERGGRTLVLTTDPHPLQVTYALTLPGIKAVGAPGPGTTVDLDYTLTGASRPQPVSKHSPASVPWDQPVAWAPALRASSGTDSRSPQFEPGDWENGRALFQGEKLQCAKCHRIRGEGPGIGPDLSNLKDRDFASVLRDVRDPNATLHPDYVTYQAELKNGDTLTGFLSRSETGTADGAADRITLVDATGRELTVQRSDVIQLHPTGLSLMPTGLLDGQSDAAIRDLMTFLMFEPVVRTRAELLEVERAIAQTSMRETSAKTSGTQPPLKVVLVASSQDHGPGQHDYPAWQKRWTPWLASASPAGIQVSQAWEWPTPEQFRTADVIVFYYWNHRDTPERLAEFDAYQQRGGGTVLLHSAVISDKAPEKLAERIGLAATPDRVKYRHTPFTLELTPGNPFTRGLPERLSLLDEPYWPMIGDVGRVQVLASVQIDGSKRPLIWSFQRGPGRVFASIPGHYSWTLEDPLWRTLVLRGIAWASHRDPDSFTALASVPAPTAR